MAQILLTVALIQVAGMAASYLLAMRDGWERIEATPEGIYRFGVLAMCWPIMLICFAFGCSGKDDE